MKNLLKLIPVVLLFVSCKGSPKSPEASGSAVSKNIDGLVREVTGKNANKDEGYARLMEELLVKDPLSNAEFLEAFPKKIGNLSLDEAPYNGTDNVDAATQVMIGNYGNSTIKMKIIDAVGNLASQAIYHLKYYDLLNLESDENTKYLKKERNGILTSGVYVSSVSESELKFLYDNRFYVTAEGKGIDVDQLWDILNVNTSLKRFKELNK